MKQPKICVAGSANMDLVTSVKRMPIPGETILGTAFHTFFGGKGANQAVMAAKLGGEVTMLAKVGKDVFGKQYLENFKSYGIITDHIGQTAEHATGIAAITVEESGQNSIIVVGGANMANTPAEMDDAKAVIHSAGAAVCQLEIPLETTQRFLEIAKAGNVATIFNPAPAQPLPDEIYPLCDYFCPNESETALLTGMQVKTVAEAEKAAQIFLEKGVGAVIITLGSDGALYVSKNKTLHVPALKVKAVDTTGAGDSFLGTFAYFIADGSDVETALRNAVKASAISVQKAGAQTSYPTYEECNFGS